MRSRSTQDAACWVIALLALIFLTIMHVALPNTGGSGADLPQALLVWCALLVLIAGCAWILCHQRLQLTPCARMLTASAVLLTLPWLWSPHPDWQLDALPRLGGCGQDSVSTCCSPTAISPPGRSRSFSGLS